MSLPKLNQTLGTEGPDVCTAGLPMFSQEIIEGRMEEISRSTAFIDIGASICHVISRSRLLKERRERLKISEDRFCEIILSNATLKMSFEALLRQLIISGKLSPEFKNIQSSAYRRME